MTFYDAWARFSAPYRRVWWAFVDAIVHLSTRALTWFADRYE